MTQTENNGSQFIALNGLSFSPRSDKMMSVSSTLKECARASEAVPHVKNPQPAKVLYGIPPLEIEAKLREIIEKCRDPLGRKIRIDAIVLSSGVASIKLPPSLKNINSKKFKKWVKKLHKFLQKKFGEQYVNLTLHTDEANLHCHYFILPKITENNLLDISEMHPGFAAQAELRDSKAGKQQKDIVYKEAMRHFQNEFYEAVSIECGHTRYGPRRRRLTRKEWHLEQNKANLISKIISAKNDRISNLKDTLSKIAKFFGVQPQTAQISKTEIEESLK